MSYLVDSHCHLEYLSDTMAGGLDEVLASTRAKGVQQFLSIGVSQGNADTVKRIAETYADVHCAIGIHPLDLKQSAPVTKAWLLEAIDHPKVVAIGETGLDLYYQPEIAEQQQASFELHLQVAAQVAKPVVIHSRQARALTIALLEAYQLPATEVLHCFTEDWAMAKKALDLGYYISLSGIVTFNNAHELREIAKKLLADRLLVETDSPYLAPVPYRGKGNLPEYVKEVAQCIADIRNVDYETFAAQTTENLYRLFPLAKANG